MISYSRPCIDNSLDETEFGTSTDFIEFFFDAVAQMTAFGVLFNTCIARLENTQEIAAYEAFKKSQQIIFIEARVTISGKAALFIASVVNLQEIAEKFTEGLFEKRATQPNGVYQKTFNGELFRVLNIENLGARKEYITYANVSNENESYRVLSTNFHTEHQHRDGTWVPKFKYLGQFVDTQSL